MHDFLATLVPICSNFTWFDLDFIMIPITLYALLIFTSYFLFHDSSFSSNASNLYNSDVIIYKIKKWREQFYLWTSLPNFPITTSIKGIIIKSRSNQVKLEHIGTSAARKSCIFLPHILGNGCVQRIIYLKKKCVGLVS
jgi:hypothetical protein